VEPEVGDYRLQIDVTVVEECVVIHCLVIVDVAW
jgi:hypothetical protein